MPHLRTAKLAAWQIRSLCYSGGALWLSGAAWLLLHYFGRIKGEFGPATNPAEPWMLRIHGFAMIAALLAVGSLLVVHIRKGWAYRKQRMLGLTLSIGTGILILSGYLLYYVGDEEIRGWISAAHWLIGLALAVIFILHYRGSRRLG